MVGGGPGGCPGPPGGCWWAAGGGDGLTGCCAVGCCGGCPGCCWAAGGCAGLTGCCAVGCCGGPTGCWAAGDGGGAAGCCAVGGCGGLAGCWAAGGGDGAAGCCAVGCCGGLTGCLAAGGGGGATGCCAAGGALGGCWAAGGGWPGRCPGGTGLTWSFFLGSAALSGGSCWAMTIRPSRSAAATCVGSPSTSAGRTVVARRKRVLLVILARPCFDFGTRLSSCRLYGLTRHNRAAPEWLHCGQKMTDVSFLPLRPLARPAKPANQATSVGRPSSRPQHSSVNVADQRGRSVHLHARPCASC